MSVADASGLSRHTVARSGAWFGLYPAVVIAVVDPEGLGRVRVRLPWSADGGAEVYDAWARQATLMAGAQHGSWFVPDVETEVLVAFEGGDVTRPCVVGALWSQKHVPPVSMDQAGRNHIKTLRSRTGLAITLDDQDGAERLTIETPGGQRIVLEDGPGAIQLRDSHGNAVLLETSGVTVQAAAKVSVQAAVVHVSAGSVTIDTPLATCSGTLKADTVIANSVISASYTPGAGNIW